MSTLRAALTTLALTFCATTLAWAHHSAAMFDFTKVGEAEGVVKEIRVINPHMSLTLVVSDTKATASTTSIGQAGGPIPSRSAIRSR
jgi:Family of unknown function (DUF6152)